MGRETAIEELEAPETQQAETTEEYMGKININTADEEELMQLDGIGEKLSARIIADRTEKGVFSRIEDIMRVSGIGEKTFANIKEGITVEE